MNESSVRARVLRELLDHVHAVRPGERALVAIDGVDGVGKSHLVGELIDLAARIGARPTVGVSIDGFHRPRAERLASGTGPDGFYRGSYCYDAFRAAVVEPARQGRAITPAVWDVARDVAVEAMPVTTAPDAVVLVDGIFLQRAELRDIWDAAVWVHAPFAVTVPRGNARFGPGFEADPEAPSNHRYVGGQRLYLAEIHPAELADWVLDNTDLDDPRLHHASEDREAPLPRGRSGPTTHHR